MTKAQIMADTPKDALDYLKTERVKNVGKFDQNKYSVQQLTYPIDLLSPRADASGVNEYGNNYVIFYINVSDESKLIKQQRVKTVNIDATERNRGIQNARNIKNNVDKGNIQAGTVAAGALSDIVGNEIGRSIGLDTGAVGTKAGIISAVALQATGDNLANFSRPQKRLSTAIALHIPNNLVTRYGMNWQDENNSFFSYITTGAGEVEKFINSAKGSFNWESPIDSLKPSLSKLGTVAQDILTANVLNASSGISSATGLAPNPNKEQVFNGVDFRQFTMEYQFFPRSAQEAESIKNIIQMFKYHMHPEFKDENNFIYIYPSEFDIAFYNGPEENRNIHRHSSCVLVDMSVNYTPNGAFNTFANGVPTQTNIVLTFRELTQLTKDNIAEGY